MIDFDNFVFGERFALFVLIGVIGIISSSDKLLSFPVLLLSLVGLANIAYRNNNDFSGIDTLDILFSILFFFFLVFTIFMAKEKDDAMGLKVVSMERSRSVAAIGLLSLLGISVLSFFVKFGYLDTSDIAFKIALAGLVVILFSTVIFFGTRNIDLNKQEEE